MKTKILVVFILLLCLYSCKKEIDDSYRPEFIGKWYCDWVNGGSNYAEFSIFVDSNSYAVYQEYIDGPGASISGIARANDRHFKIGRLHHFGIKDYPHKIDTATSSILLPDSHNTGQLVKANWKMSLTAPNFYMGTGDYYKTNY